MKVTRLAAVALMLLLALTAPAASASPPGESTYRSVPVERRCLADRDNDEAWSTYAHLIVDGHHIDLYCGDRVLVGPDGRCWFEYGGRISPARCREH